MAFFTGSAAGIVFTHELRCKFFVFLPLAAKLLTELKNTEMMARTSSTITKSLIEIEQHTSV